MIDYIEEKLWINIPVFPLKVFRIRETLERPAGAYCNLICIDILVQIQYFILSIRIAAYITYAWILAPCLDRGVFVKIALSPCI